MMMRSLFWTAVVALMLGSPPLWADYDAGRKAWDAGNPAQALSEWRKAANAGDRRAMLALGRLYVQGLGAPRDYVLAYMWFNLAAGRGETGAVKERDAIEAKLTPAERAEAQKRARTWAAAGPPPPRAIFRDCGECPEMVVVPAESYLMGSPSPSTGAGRYDDEGPVHQVVIGEPFAVGVKEVTRGEYGRFVRATGHSAGDSCWTYEDGEWKDRGRRNWEDPGFEQTDEHPVVCVNWEDAKAYVKWLSDETGEGYRLLSESEWEYVARGGSGTARYWGEDGQCRYANGGDRSVKGRYSDWRWGVASCDDGHVHTAPVGSFAPNGFGLYDVLGNVWEWVEDCWNGSYAGAPSDGRAWESGNCGRRVLRGGSWNNAPWNLRSAVRGGLTTGNRDGYNGFRVARMLTP